MFITVLSVELFMPQASSLKDKRMALKSIKDRLRNNFNISVAEVGNNDKWQRSTLAVAGISNDKKYLSGQMDQVIKFIEDSRLVEIIDCQREEI